MKNTFGRDNEDDGNDESANLFNIAIQAVADALVHFSDAFGEAVCWSFVGLAKDIAVSRKLTKYCLRSLSEVLEVQRKIQSIPAVRRRRLCAYAIVQKNKLFF